jgi:hypothetical protein
MRHGNDLHPWKALERLEGRPAAARGKDQAADGQFRRPAAYGFENGTRIGGTRLGKITTGDLE